MVEVVEHVRLAGLAARRTGPADGVPLLLVHGLTDDGGCWPDAVARWRGRPLWCLDLPSHGRSPRLPAAALADPMAAVADAVAEAVTALADLRGTAPVGVGHSMGAGALAVAAAAGAPLAGLVLEDPRVAHESTRVRERLGRMRAREVRTWHEDPDAARAALEAACPGWTRAEVDACAAARPLGDPAFLATGRSGLHGDDSLQADVVRRAAQRVPTLLVTGDRPGAIWGPGRLALVDGSPVEVAVVAGGDHTVRRTAPEGYHAVVDPFLDRVLDGVRP